MFVILALLFIFPATRQDGCGININSADGFGQPLFFWQDSTDLVFPPLDTLPYLNGNATLNPGDFVTISCDIGSLTSNLGYHGSINTAFCDSSNILRINGGILQPETLACVHDTLDLGGLKRTGTVCAQNAEIFQIVVQANSETSLSLVDICFDYQKLNVVYVHYNISKDLIFKSHFVSGSLGYDSGVYDLPTSLYDLYSGENQQFVVNSVLGLPLNSTIYVNNSGDFFDFIVQDFRLDAIECANPMVFVYQIPQLAVLRYVNSIPVWYTVWDNLYSAVGSVVTYTISRLIGVEAFSGTFGVATLPHGETEEETELYLYIGEEGQKRIPIPRLIWHLFYHEEEKSAVVLVTVNNPFRVIEEDIICEDISSSLPWLDWNKDNVTQGFSYACSYEALKAVVWYLPELDVERVLS